MAKENESVKALERVDFWPTNSPDVVAIEVVDERGRKFGAAMNATGITHVIGKALDVAVETVFATATTMSKLEVPPAHIDGSRLELKPGRSPTEIATTLTIGCVQVVVFLPLPEVLRACAELIRSVEPDDSPGLH